MYFFIGLYTSCTTNYSTYSIIVIESLKKCITKSVQNYYVRIFWFEFSILNLNNFQSWLYFSAIIPVFPSHCLEMAHCSQIILVTCTSAEIESSVTKRLHENPLRHCAERRLKQCLILNTSALFEMVRLDYLSKCFVVAKVSLLC